MRGHYFVGYERRRVRAALAGRRISRTLHDVILRHMVRGRRVYFSGVDHEQLVGVYRSDPLESFVHNGESFLPDGRRYLIPDELDRLRSNRFFRVDESSIVRIGPEKILGTVHYVAVHSVGENVRTVLENADRRLRRPSSPHRAVRTIVTLARDLLSIHPFIDGNGRTVRLLADHLLSCRGLPPCLYPNELDLLMTEDEAYHFTLRGMCAYVDEMEKAVTAGTTGTLGRTGSGGRGAAGRY
ncbi:MAG: Fic family protein [Candidatus Riflebacteria bacterium]|nr:Fic family protein [Candidatus Riflebacteria bacterium]